MNSMMTDKENLDQNVFDAAGYRYNVGIVIVNQEGKVFLGKRCGQNAWQFPQGGLCAGESTYEAMLRELCEETGLTAQDITVLGVTQNWLSYSLPMRFRRKRRSGLLQCVGQKQKWFLVLLTSADTRINLAHSASPEFETWHWTDFWSPTEKVVHFKRKVYTSALEELSQFLPDELKSAPPKPKKTTIERHKHFRHRRRFQSSNAFDKKQEF